MELDKQISDNRFFCSSTENCERYFAVVRLNFIGCSLNMQHSSNRIDPFVIEKPGFLPHPEID